MKSVPENIYLNTCSTSFPRAQNASFSNLNSYRECQRSAAAAAQDSTSPEADGKGPCVVQSFSCVQLFVTPWATACQASLSFTISWSLLEFMSIELVMLSNHLIRCCPLLLLPSIFPSIRVFSNELVLHVTRVYAPRFFVSSQQKFGVTDIKAPWRVTALRGQTVL